jgi:hypothetical protein
MRPRLFLSRAAVFSFCIAFPILAQESAILSNNGDPMRVAFACAEDELQSVGMSCTEDEPCPIYLELSSIVPDGRKIFVAGNLHSNSATLTSVLLMSEDSGSTWKEPSSRIRASALDQIQFYSLQAGWASGETQYPLSRDPFFLITTDGGTSWHKVPVGEEGTPGAIQRFWFDSAQHGEMVIDAGKASSTGRYLSYETETGGGNWVLHGKSDQLPKLRLAPASTESADLRARPSRDGKTYSIEQRAGDRWTNVASFVIEVATCRSTSPELKEPETDKAAVDTPPPPSPASTKKSRKK